MFFLHVFMCTCVYGVCGDQNGSWIPWELSQSPLQKQKMVFSYRVLSLAPLEKLCSN